MSNSIFSQGKPPCTKTMEEDDDLMALLADSMETPVCFAANDGSLYWSDLKPNAISALMKTFPMAAEAVVDQGFWPVRVFTLGGDRRIRYLCALPVTAGDPPPSSLPSSSPIPEDAWHPMRHEAMSEMGMDYVSNFVKLRAEAMVDNMSWFAELDTLARKQLLRDGVTPVWHNAIITEYVRLCMARKLASMDVLDVSLLTTAKQTVYARHKFFKMKLPSLDSMGVVDYDGHYSLKDRSPATPEQLFRRKNSDASPSPSPSPEAGKLSESKTQVSPKARKLSESKTDEHEASHKARKLSESEAEAESKAKAKVSPSPSPPSSRKISETSRKRPAAAPVSPDDSSSKKSKQSSIVRYFKGESVAQIRMAHVNDTVQSVLDAYKPWVENTVTALRYINECCYLHIETPVLVKVPSNKELAANESQPFKSAIDLLENYVADTQMSMVYACGIPRNKKRLVVFVNEEPFTPEGSEEVISKRSYVLATPETLDSLIERADSKDVTVCYHEVFFMNRVYTRIIFDIDAPWPGTLDCDADLYKRMANTLQALCYVVWSNTVGVKIQMKPLQMAVFRRPAKNKWSLRIVIKLPFNCSMRNIDVVNSFVSSIVREAEAAKLPYLALVSHPTKKDLFAHFDDCCNSDATVVDDVVGGGGGVKPKQELLVHKPSKAPRWFSKTTGQYVVEEKTGWHHAKVTSSIDVNVYGSHKSVRLPYCGKLDGSKFIRVWSSTRDPSDWKLSRCLMSAPFTHNEIILLPELKETLPFATTETTLLKTKNIKWTWGVPGAAALTKDRVSACKAAAEQHYNQKFTECPKENFTTLVSNKPVFDCDLCGRAHKNKQKIYFMVFPHVWYLKCFHTTEVLYATLDPQTGALGWKERTAVCQYGE
ncbi:putative helicase-primase primase subunit [Cyprinid herpesvirus 2]|uniref:Putative helicase-primase primase subunit n=1 Tax=Cyprinid herpesvirus 2 TaxID=317878 RepID=K7PBN7_CYHV2|nr:putative helicase-primase primase subunit [Cyprinid herpesvirus 2]AFJ20481.1 putative helicase-primase primase subunit [Cyprinid herpesvirus 2]